MPRRNPLTAVRDRRRAAAVASAVPSPRRPARKAAKAPATDTVRITHPDRIVFPDTTYTKRDVADYYLAAMRWMLPELAGRPLSVVRCPNGAGAACFFQKHNAGALGSKVGSVSIEEKDGGSENYLYVDDARGVLELVQMNTIEFHPWGARIDDPDRPDVLVFDLDPGPGVEWKTMIAAAREVRALLQASKLESFVRLSGGKGVHVVVPIKRGPEWSEAKAFCEALANALAAGKPSLYLATASKAKRNGRIFIDWLRNARGATSVVSWSLRARAGAPVAMPLRWQELGRIKAPNAFDLKAAAKRAKTLKANPWEGFTKIKQSLPKLRART